MDIKHLITYMTLLFYQFFILIAEGDARAFTDLDTFIASPLDSDSPYNNDYFGNYHGRSVAPKYSLLSRLRRGYYFIDDGEITPVNPTNINQNVQTARRRQDSYSNERSENNKHKKLFVPNLFG